MNRKSKITTLLAGVIGLVFSMYGSGALAGISGTLHDFSAQGWSNGEICVVCHTPHSDGVVVDAPLWDHAVTTASFNPYTSVTGTLNASIGQPSGISKLCLSCHDGTVALDSFGGTTGGTVMSTASVNYRGTDLSNDHPVSFGYQSAIDAGDSGLNGSATVYATGLLFGTASATATVECASCHDVHDKLTIAKFLRMDNADSALCMTCHNK